jgi:hypothetical protein
MSKKIRHQPHNYETYQRVVTVQKMLVTGVDTTTIVQHGMDAWGISDRMVYIYIRKAYEMLAQDAQADRLHLIGKALARLDKLFLAAYKNNDIGRALDVQKEINKLLGLYAPTTAHVSVISDWRVAVEAALRESDDSSTLALRAYNPADWDNDEQLNDEQLEDNDNV